MKIQLINTRLKLLLLLKKLIFLNSIGQKKYCILCINYKLINKIFL